jgi:sRNA-binding carbon storage regulator CsrA
MLVIKRRIDEIVTIEPQDGHERSLTVDDLFNGGAIQITLLEVGSSWVKLAIEAPTLLKIWRGPGPIVNRLAIHDSQDAPINDFELSKN